MSKIDAKAKVDVSFSINFNLTIGEAKALDAIVGYGVEPFLEVFYRSMGRAYLQPHESEMKKLFERVKAELPKEIRKIDTAESAIKESLKIFNK